MSRINFMLSWVEHGKSFITSGPETPKWVLWQTVKTQMKWCTMQHNAAFHLGLHCLPRQNQSSKKEIQYFWEIITCDSSIYTMDHPDFTVPNFKGNSIGPKRVKASKCHVIMGRISKFPKSWTEGAQWLSGRVLDSKPRGRGFEPHRRHCLVVLEQDTFILA